MDHSGILRNAKKHRTVATVGTEDVLNRLSVVCCRVLDYLSLDLWRRGEREAWQHPGMKGTKAILFRGITSTNIVERLQLLCAHRVLRASLSCPHYSSDKAILDGLIRSEQDAKSARR